MTLIIRCPYRSHNPPCIAEDCYPCIKAGVQTPIYELTDKKDTSTSVSKNSTTGN